MTSPTGTIQIQLARRKEAAVTAKLAEREKKEPGATSTTPWSSDFFCCPGCRA